jgi:uncharacterized protein YqfA (UPF0365 family)
MVAKMFLKYTVVAMILMSSLIFLFTVPPALVSSANDIDVLIGLFTTVGLVGVLGYLSVRLVKVFPKDMEKVKNELNEE